MATEIARNAIQRRDQEGQEDVPTRIRLTDRKVLAIGQRHQETAYHAQEQRTLPRVTREHHPQAQHLTPNQVENLTPESPAHPPALAPYDQPGIHLNPPDLQVELDPEREQPQEMPIDRGPVVIDQAPETKMQQTGHRVPIIRQEQGDHGEGEQDAAGGDYIPEGQEQAATEDEAEGEKE